MSYGNKKPTHGVYSIRAYTTGGEQRSEWTKLGVAWAHRGGKGFNIKLTRLPLDGALTIYPLADHKDNDNLSTGEKAHNAPSLPLNKGTHIMNTRYEIQTFTLCGGWINTWFIIDKDNSEAPKTFATEAEAQQALDGFLSEIQEEIDAGHRSPAEGYSPDDYRIVPIPP